MKKFWYSINLADADNTLTLNQNPSNIRLSGILHFSGNTIITNMMYFTLNDAVACAIALYVFLFPLLGRVGPGEVITLSIVGGFTYVLNECSFWRLNIADNGYGMRIFLFGSVAGIVASLILGR
jgi:hypothetical protein